METLKGRFPSIYLSLFLIFGAMVFAATPNDTTPKGTTPNGTTNPDVAPAAPAGSAYQLGPGDEIKVKQPNAEELDGTVARIDGLGFADLPLAGRLHLAGMTVEQAQSEIASKLTNYLLRPDPIVSVAEYRSQPVSVIGAVNNPGVIQLQGKKNLMEAISMAGGLRPDAGSEVQITRRIANGHIPAGKEALDPSGEFSVAKIDLTRLMAGQDPAANIAVLPNDLISVPRTEVIYVTGKVHHPGGFPLGANSEISIMQALSLAEGVGPQSSPKNAKIFRPRGDTAEKDEIPVDVASILSGKKPDVELKPRDILFIPDSTSKKAGVRAAEAALQAVTGFVIWHTY